jgi:3-oxoacyl-[acyl-carrier protein] reductase
VAAGVSPAPPVALVTGGGRNIGRAIALRLGQDGYRVAINYRSDHAAATFGAALVAAQAPEAALFPADVTRDDEAAGLVAAVLARWGRLDVLVNAVGPMVEGSATDTAPDDFRAMLDGNLLSAYQVTRHALPALRAVGGRVVNLGSLNVELARGASEHAAYNAAKTALVVWTRSLARSEGPRGVRVNMVCPGVIATDDTPAALRRDLPRRVPLGRLGRPEEVAEAVAWLVSERAGYVTGAVLAVSGGLWV